MRYYFILPNDTFKSEYETFRFHKGMTYSVSHVFNDKGKLKIFIKDKNGFDVLFKMGLFEATAKTNSASEERQKRARLDFFWDNPNTSMVINPSYHYNFETTEFFDLENKSYFCGEKYKDVIATIKRRKQQYTESGWKHTDVEGTSALFKSKQDYYDYFKKIDVEKFKINGLNYEVQSRIDHNYFMLRLPQYDESVLNLCDDSNTIVDNFVHANEMTLDEFLKLAAYVIFDEEELSDENKQIVYNIIEAYELLPNSHGPTSVAKLLAGKEKKTIASVKHLSGTCTKLKQPQMFELCNIVESFMYVNKIFVKKEAYEMSDKDEWLGVFEFIGTKAVNTEKLLILKNKLK